MNRLLFAFRLVVGLALALALGALVTADGRAETVLTRGNIGAVASLDPHKITGTWENHVVGDLFEGLIAEDAEAKPIPGQAERWEISRDRRVYIFHLRANARWSNGEPVTAHDFEYAFQRILAPTTQAPYATMLYPVAGAREYHSGRMPDPNLVGVKALDDKTLLIILRHPAPYFLTLLKHWTAYPVPRKVVQAHGSAWTSPANIACNGAYCLEARSPDGVTTTLVKNPYYYGSDRVAIDRVVFRSMPNPTLGLALFRTQGLDLYPDFPARKYAWLKQYLPDETRVAPYLGTYFYSFNLTRPPFDDLRVRRALTLTIDRGHIAEDIRGTGEVPAFSFVPLGVLNYQPARADFAEWPMAQRIEEAQALMTEAGFSAETPLQLTLSYNEGENHRRIAEAVAEDWETALPVAVALAAKPVSDHYADLQAKDYQVGRAGWIGDYNDAQNFLFLGEALAGQLNYASYSNPDYDILMDKASAQEEVAPRADLMHQAEALLLRDLPYAPIYYYVSQNMVSTRVMGYQDNVEDIHRTRWLSLE